MKTVLITGIGKGIGQALAENFLSEDFSVIGTYHETRPLFTKKNFVAIPLNLSSPESIINCIEQIHKLQMKIDILINNSGILMDEDEVVVNVDKLRATLEVNLIGTIDFTERMLPYIQNGGHVINISSTAGMLSTLISRHPHHYPSYKISKTALNMYTRTLASRLQEQEIVVSSVHPGWVKTDMGGQEADITSKQAAQEIFDFALTHPETGLFWHAGKRLPW